jgi:hypothetical protein
MSAKGSRAKCLAESRAVAGFIVAREFSIPETLLARSEQPMNNAHWVIVPPIDTREGTESTIWLMTVIVPSRAPWAAPISNAIGLLATDQAACRGPGRLSMIVLWNVGATAVTRLLIAWRAWWRRSSF